jgi:hypothetical protein
MKLRTFLFAVPLALVLAMNPGDQSAFAGQNALPNGNLTSQIDYWFVGHFGELDDEGRLLVWEATISGDLNGTIKWWFESPPPVVNSPFSFYAGRWEIWADGELVLAGESAGKTVFPDGLVVGGADGIWDGHGVVTEAQGRMSPLKGTKISESGPVVIGDTPPVSFYGTGMFQVY